MANHMSAKFALASAIVLAVPTIAAPALAEDSVTRTVSLSDVDLSTESGVALLNRRIEAAVSSICGRQESRDLQQVMAVRKCRTGAHASAVNQTQLAVADARRRNAFIHQAMASFAAK
ncbi:MAG TPA: UrcA family protein [Sphingobium sp.]